MKVKELIKMLSKLDLEKDVLVETVYSNNCLDIEDVKEINNNVYIKVDDTDFELNLGD